MPEKKTAVTLSVEDDVLRWFEAQGAEFQHRINAHCESTLKRISSSSKRASQSDKSIRHYIPSNLSLKFDWHTILAERSHECQRSF